MAKLTRHSALVTGATGFIGGRLAECLVAEGWSVRVLVRNPQRLTPALLAATEVITGDLADLNALELAVADVSVIFHCAANVNTWDTPDAYHAANVTGVKNLLHAIKQGNLGLSRLVHLSTMDVYGFPEQPCDEQCQTASSGFGYGDSKLLGEAVLQVFCATHQIPYTIIRPGNVIGPRSQFIQRIGESLKSGLMLKIEGGRANAGFIYIDNLVEYLLWAASTEQAVNQCYNARDGYDVSWAVFIAAFRQALGGHGLVIDLPFALANAIACGFEQFYQLFLPAREPVLHRLLVRLFGRTCGHGAEKIRSDSRLSGRISFDEALNRSTKWFLEEHLSTKNGL